MKRLIVSIVFLCSWAFGQVGVTPISGRAVDQYGQPIPYAQIRVCSVTSTGIPCTPTATIYQDYGMTQLVSNPYSADAYGNYLVYAGALAYPNLYVIQQSANQGLTWNYVENGPGVSSINGNSGAFTFTGGVTCTGETCNFTGGGVGCPTGQYCLTTMTGYSDACAALNAFRSSLISSGVTDADINATSVFTGTVNVTTNCWATVPALANNVLNTWSEHDHFDGSLKLVTPVGVQIVPNDVTVEAPMAFIWPVDYGNQDATTSGAQIIAAAAASGPLVQIGSPTITSTDPRGVQLKGIGVNCIDPTGGWNAGSIGIQNGYSQENTGGDFVAINGCSIGLDLENFPDNKTPPAGGTYIGGSQNSAQWRHLIIESVGVLPLTTTSVGLVKVLTAGAGQTPGTYTSTAVGGGGVGATAQYTVGVGNTITSAALTNAGSGYTSEPYFPVASNGGSPGSLVAYLTPTWVGVQHCSGSSGASGNCTQSRGIQDASIIGPTGNCVACYGVMADGENLSLTDIGIEQEEDAVLVGSRYQAYVNISNVFGQGQAATDMRSVVHVAAPNSSSTVVLNNVGGTNQRDSFTFMDDITPAHNMCSNIDLNAGSPCSSTGASVSTVAVSTPGTGQTDGTYQVYSSIGPEGGWAQINLVISGGICTTASVKQYGYGFQTAPTFTAPTTTGTPCTLTATLGTVASTKLVRSIAFLGCNTQSGYGLNWTCSTSSAAFPSEISITGNAGSATTASACPTCTGGITSITTNYTLANNNQSQLVNMSPPTSAGITATLPSIPSNPNWWTTLWNGSANFPVYLATSGPNFNGYTTQATLPPLTSVRLYSNGTDSYYSPDLPMIVGPTTLTAQSGSTGDQSLSCRAALCPSGLYSITFYITVTTQATGGGTLAPYCKYTDSNGGETQTLASMSTSTTGYSVANCTLWSPAASGVKWGVALTGTATSLQYSVVVAVGNAQGMGSNPPNSVKNIAGGTLGSAVYQSDVGTTAVTAANTSASTLCLTETGTGSVGAAPVWGACSGSSAAAFSAITGSTNTSAAMVVGTGASLAASGTGTIAATSVPGAGVSGNISGNSANVTGTVAIANGGTGQTTAAAALTALGGASAPTNFTVETAGFTAVAGVSGYKINCAAPCTVMLPASITTGYSVGLTIMSNSSTVTVNPNGVPFYVASNGTSIATLVLQSGQTEGIFTDGTNYLASAPLVGSTYITVTPGATGNVFALTASLPSTLALTSHKYVQSYNSTTGTFSSAQPVSGDLSDLGTAGGAAQLNGSGYVPTSQGGCGAACGTFATQNYTTPPVIGGGSPNTVYSTSLYSTGAETGSGYACLHINSVGLISNTVTDCNTGSGTVSSFSGDSNIITNVNSTGAVTTTISGVSGAGVYFNSTSSWKSTAVLAANALMVGGGAGNAYTTGNGDFTYTTHTLAGGSSSIFDMSGGATMKVPSSAGYAPTTAAVLGYNSTNNMLVFGNGSSAINVAGLTGTAHGLKISQGTGSAETSVAVCGTSLPIVGVSGADPICSKVTLTQPATGSTVTVVDGKTLTASNTMDVAKTTGVAGAIPWFDTTTSESASALLAQYGVMIGGGASSAPSTIAVPSADSAFMGFSAATPAWKAMPTTGTNGCAGTTDILQYNTSTHAYACGTAGSGLSGLTADVVPMATSSTVIANSSPQLDIGLTTSGAMTFAGPISAGSGAPACTGGTAGAVCGNEGTDPSTASGVDELIPDATKHDWIVQSNGGVAKLLGSSIGYNSGSISASVGSTNVATTANFPTGQYILSCDVAVTAVGSSPTLAVTIGWTDITGTARTKTCTTGVVTVSDNPVMQTITSNGSAAITVTQTLAVSTATWWTTVGLMRLQ